MKRTGAWVEVADGSVLRELITRVSMAKLGDGKYKLVVHLGSDNALWVGNFSKQIAAERMRRITGGKGIS